MTTKNPAIKMQPAFDFKSLIAVLGIAVLIGIFATIGTSHQPDTEYGWYSILPTVFVLAFALLTHRTVEALFSGAIVGLIMLNPT